MIKLYLKVSLSLLQLFTHTYSKVCSVRVDICGVGIMESLLNILNYLLKAFPFLLYL